MHLGFSACIFWFGREGATGVITEHLFSNLTSSRITSVAPSRSDQRLQAIVTSCLG